MPLVPCPSCSRHVRETVCPFCGTHVAPAAHRRTQTAGLTRAAVALGAALVMNGCKEDDPVVTDAAVDSAVPDTGVVPAYGAVPLDSAVPDAAVDSAIPDTGVVPAYGAVPMDSAVPDAAADAAVAAYGAPPMN